MFVGTQMNSGSARVWSRLLTAQALGKCKTMRCFVWRTWTAILNSLLMTVDGCACDSKVCRSACVRNY